MDNAAVRGAQRKNIVAPPFRSYRRQRTAAPARIRILDDTVSKIVANHGLNPIGEIRQQHGVRPCSRRDRPKLGVDRFEDDPIGVHMKPSSGARETDAHALGCPILVDEDASERSLDRRRASGHKALAT
jgi:hypothetical protein